MDEKTLLAIIRRMDDLERRVMARIDSLDAFRFKLIGGSLLLTGTIAVVAEFLRGK